MATWRLAMTQRPGGTAQLDEFAGKTWDVPFEQAKQIATDATRILRARYRRANPLCYATEWTGDFADPLRARANTTSKNRESTMTKAKTETEQSVNTLGVLAYFRGSNVWITPPALRLALDQNGIKAHVMDPASRPVERATSAVRNFRGKGVRADVIAKTETEISIGILVFEKAAEKAVQWRQVEAVTYNKDTGWTAPITDHGRDFVATAQKWQTQIDYYILRKLILDQVNALESFSIGGGIQYVHADALDQFRKIQAVASAIPGATLYGIRLDSADPSTVGAVGDAALQSMTEAVEGVLTELSEWKEKANGKKTTLDRLMGDLTRIRGRAAELAKALRFSTTELETAVGSAVAEIMAAIDDETTPASEPKAEPKAAVKPDEEPKKDEPPAEPKAEVKAPEPTPEPTSEPKKEEPTEATILPGKQEPADGGRYIPTVEELENAKVPQLTAWAQALGLSLKHEGSKKRKTGLELASEMSALRQSRKSA
jgi:hypothetical protein